MKETKSKQEQTKRSAEDWVSIAREFGENCVKLQRDPNLSLDQKLEKQRVLGKEMAKEIEADSHLKESDKRQMIESIQSYMDEWQELHDIIQQGGNTSDSAQQKATKDSSSKKKK